MEQFCVFLQSFSKITWTKTTLTICLIPCVLSILALFTMFILTTELPGGVVSNSRVCAQVGKDVMEEGGSAVDAAIATMLCEGIALPNSAGIGGGFVALLYIGGQVDSIVATPTIPEAFANLKKNERQNTTRAKAIGVPGELMGYWEMHQRYGILSWKRLMQPSIKLCEKGMPMTQWFASILRFYSPIINKHPSLSEVFPYWKKDMYHEDHKLTFPVLAKTLRQIADHGVSVFYNGDIGRKLVADIRKKGGFLKFSDLQNYRVLWNNKPPSFRVKQKFKVITTPLPTSGALMGLILNIVKSFKFNENSTQFWHNLVEATKHAFGLGQSLEDAANNPNYTNHITETYLKMINDDFASEIRDKISQNSIFNNTDYYGSNNSTMHSDKVSANICIYSPNGDAIAATTSLSYQFGAFFRSAETGIIPNNLLKVFDETDDATLPDRLSPGGRILTPHCPSIVLYQSLATVFFVISASGGLKAITLIAMSIIRYTLMGQGSKAAADSPYLHNQLVPNWIEYEDFNNHDILEDLKELGHTIVRKQTELKNFTSAACIGRRSKNLDMHFNLRVGGSKQLITPKLELNNILIVAISALTMSVIGIMLYEVLNPSKHFARFVP